MMKAVVYHKYGPPDVLMYEDMPKPVPGKDDVLLKVYAASVNPLDWHSLRGEPMMQRFVSGLFSPRAKILGADVAGIVESAGANVSLFKPGDELMGDLYWSGYGAFAEYVSIPQDKLVRKPTHLSLAQAAAIPQGALTALHALRDQGQIVAGQKVLVNGASGGVGSFTVMLAKSFGAEVTGVCSGRNQELVKSTGADQVIDYSREDFTKDKRKYDLIVDLVANHPLPRLLDLLNPGGNCVVVGFSTLSHMLKVRIQSPRLSRKTGKSVGMLIPKEKSEDLAVLKEIFEKNKLEPVIDREYPLQEVPDAIRYLEEGHARGKVVITVNHTS